MKLEEWVERHQHEGHQPHPAPTKENPERWECKCDPDAAWTAVWRILTIEQIRQKFAHLKKAPNQPALCRLPSPPLVQPPPIARPTAPISPLRIADRHADGAGRRTPRG